MIRGIVFDCFGVLATDGWLPFKRQYFGQKGDVHFDEATDLNRMVDTGHISYDEFIDRVAKLAGVPRQTAWDAIGNNAPNEELFTYIHDELKPHYPLGLLSNAAKNWLNELFAPEQVQLFDAVALSFETGVVKPDERAYQIIAERLELPMDECVFIDDQERYCTGARDSGMQAIWYQNFAQMKNELNEMLAAN